MGERGEGEFERISWDEALDTVASELGRVKETYGPEALMLLVMAGDAASLHLPFGLFRLLGMAGGFTTGWGATSFHGGTFSSYFTYGTEYASNTRDDLLNSRLIIMWGWNPAVTICGTNTPWYLAQAKERGTKVVAVDPCYNDSAATFAQEWIPIRPGTDAAMIIAMAFVMINENIQDQKFLDAYTIGFDKFKDYVLGLEDGVPKTPAWAETITGAPAAIIEKLAREYATVKPAALMAGIAPGRTAFGEQYHRAASTLAAMTGNIGIHGGDAAARAWESILGGYPYEGVTLGSALPFVPNPIESPPVHSFWFHERYPHIHYSKVADAILKGKAGGYPADYKLLFISNANYLNSFPNINKIVRALKALEFIVIEEQFMTSTAKFADIILPTTTFMERNDIALGVGTPFYGFQNKIIEPLGECKSHNEIAKGLAARMGLSNFDQETEETRLRDFAQSAGIPDYDRFRDQCVHRINLSEPYIAFKAQIEDPENNPFPTPSGKIEIYSQQIADMNNPLLPPIPTYIENWEGPNDPLAQRFPIQLVTNHAKGRANAQFANIPWLRELTPQTILINTEDARVRKIRDGDMVRVFNARGETRVPAEITERIMPGVAILPHGAWYDPDGQGIDKAGSPNVLSLDEPSPAGSFPYNTILMEIEKI